MSFEAQKATPLTPEGRMEIGEGYLDLRRGQEFSLGLGVVGDRTTTKLICSLGSCCT